MAVSDAVWKAWLDNPEADPVVLLETGYVQDSDIIPFRASDKGYYDRTVAHAAQYPPIIVGEVAIDEAPDGVRISDITVFVEEEIWAARFRGQTFEIFYGDRSWPRADFVRMATCKVRFALRDSPRLYRFQLNQVGEGLLDQIVDLPGVPYILGGATNFAPTRTGPYTYEAYASTYKVFGYVADKGKLLTFSAGGGGAGTYDGGWNSGTKKLLVIIGTMPQGVVTVRTAGGDSISDLFAEINAMIDQPFQVAASIAAFDGYQLGHYLTDKEAAASLVDYLAGSFGGNVRFNNAEQLEIFRFQNPGAPTRTLTDADLVGNPWMRLVAQDDYCGRVVIGFQRMWYQMRQEDFDLAANLPVETEQEWRLVTAGVGNDANPKTFRANTALQVIDQAVDEAARRLALMSAVHERYEYSTGRRGFADNIGDTVRVESADYGLQAGDDFLVIGNRRILTAQISELLLWR